MLNDTTVLLDDQELEVTKIAAVDLGAYWNSFVYVEAGPVSASEACTLTETQVKERVEQVGYCDEEVCLFKGKYLPRGFWDDGAAEIEGKVVDFNGEAELRIRHLSKYNLLIAGNDSCVNCMEFDDPMEALMNQCLLSQDSLELLAKAVGKLRKQVSYYPK